MIRFIAIRLLQFPLILAVIYLLTFLLAWVAPGSPFQQSDRYDATAIETLKQEFHAETSWQFLAYYPWRMLQGDLGPSMYYRGFTVNEILASAVPVSVTLGLFALIIALVAGTLIGTL